MWRGEGEGGKKKEKGKEEKRKEETRKGKEKKRKEKKRKRREKKKRRERKKRKEKRKKEKKKKKKKKKIKRKKEKKKNKEKRRKEKKRKEKKRKEKKKRKQGTTHTEFEVMLVGQRVGDALNQRYGGQDLLAHQIHSRLHGGRVVFGERAHGDLAGRVPGGVKFGDGGLDVGQAVKALPLPDGVDIGAEDAVPCLAKRGVLVAHKAMEGGASRLEQRQALDGRLDDEASAAPESDLDIAGLGAVAEEGVRVRLVVNHHTHPAMRNDPDVDGVDVRIMRGEMGREDAPKSLWRRDRILLGQHCQISLVSPLLVGTTLSRRGQHESGLHMHVYMYIMSRSIYTYT